MAGPTDEELLEGIKGEFVTIDDILPDLWAVFVAIINLVFVIPVLLISMLVLKLRKPRPRGRHRA